MLLAEEEEIAFCSLPSYVQYGNIFDKRMEDLGFGRSPFQANTLGDGNCGLYSLLDQLNLPHNLPNPMFEREDCIYAR